ncbi:hypothetical protein Taro_026800 [Colocasia esculenta]|uniref:Uncharacterized protein n=1 Tax=Colocasia esculenta TaxID=4460 RepID=A0A843VPP2_COLES|nr:hypothetical protein [Colocasia esculenta]
MGRPPCCDKSNVKRGLWTAEEDKKILAYVSTHGAGNWASVPKKAGLKRCGKSCRLRWTNYLRPDLKHDEFTPEEEQLIIAIHAEIGSRWSVISGQLPGRTDNDVKNYWNTKLKKKLIARGIDPVTHKPISHVISSIHCLSGGCNSNSTAAAPAGKDVSIARAHKQKDPRVSCLTRDLIRNVLMASMLESPLGSSQLDAVADMGETSTPLQRAVGYDSKPSWELLAQLRAVNKLVTDASKVTATPPPQTTPNQPSSASCSSFSLVLPLQQEADAPGAAEAAVPPDHFFWRDFILHGVCPLLMQSEPPQTASQVGTSSEPVSAEVLLPESSLQENLAVDDAGGDGRSGDAVLPKETGMAALSCYATGEDVEEAAAPGSAPSASDIGFFVESLLNRDKEMTWEFPEFLDDPFTCP